MVKRTSKRIVVAVLVLLLVATSCAAPAPAAPTAAPTAPPKPATTAAAPAAAATTAPAAAATTAAPAAAATQPAAAPATGQPIKVGFVWGVTGPASEIIGGNSAAAHAYFDWLNGHGGVNGRPVEMDEIDTKYQTPLAVDGYKKVKQDGVVGVVLASTGDTEALSAQINGDKLTTFTYSCDAKWADPTANPYVFTICATYQDQMIDALQYVKQTWKGSAAPKIAFVYPDNPFGRSPIQTGKDTAKKLGFDAVADVNVDMAAVDATSESLKLKQANPDFVIIQNSTAGTGATLRDGKKAGITAQYIGLNYAFDEAAIKAAGAAAEGYVGVGATAFPSNDLAIAKEIKDRAPNLAANWTLRTIQGWAMGKVIAAGLAKAGANPTGESFKTALETVGPIDVGGATVEYNYTNKDHAPTDKVVMYQVKDGKPVAISGPVSPPQ